MNRSFELLILGSSSASPGADRNVSGQLLNIATRLFLIDCGEGTQMQLKRYKARIQSINHIFISHLHGDHFFGLPGLLSSMHLLGRKQTLNIYAPEGLESLIVQLNAAGDTRLNYSINWHVTNNNGLNLLFEDEVLTVHSFPLKHRVFCTGFLFSEKPRNRVIDQYKLEKFGLSSADIPKLRKGMDVLNKDGQLINNKDATNDPPAPKTYAYCSDTIFDPNLASFINGVDLLYHESTFLQDQEERAKKTFHSTAAQAAQIAKLTGAKRLLLGHFSARYRNLNDFIAEASPVFENCLTAIEGKVVKI